MNEAVMRMLLSKYPIFDQEIFDRILLLTIYPTSENQEQQLPWLQENLHFFLRICSESLQHPASPTACQASHFIPSTSLASGSFCNYLRRG
jgi:hypothetical protein